MDFAEGTLAGLPVRVYRISFSGELSYEIAVPAGHGRRCGTSWLRPGPIWA